ncbi:BspA family leucine-rich repeat surface protein [Xylocopilactobacillus apis]|uniref:Surface protein n=1 Tax=Xylocopilactobacillus apis TaxID=2932183 RepID=A0AAU9DL01_9LACO|nr:BspA family leucine-rich repeat surface protein [Xylocopilactobacillus apis]BDR55448.1 hypothetical protein KIMC2_00100 [Xylocopilactobacillus apis]
MNATSYAATVAYGQTGRSIILGHDTVYYPHTYLAQFGPSLGLKILPGYPSSGGNVGLGSTKVKFSMDGFLNQYPYKFTLDQTLEIKFSHSSGQYYLYQGGAQKWMEYEPPFSFAGEAKDINYLDENNNQVPGDDGHRIADNNFYLVTKNNYAMIQTGHSIFNGMSACTPDEAKIIANMIYYTSTLNMTTHGEDHTVKDSAAPEKPTTTVTTDNDKATITIKAADLGTDYFYRVKAKTASATKYSDVVKSTITSGLKGYVYQIDNNPNGVVTPIKDVNGEVSNLNLMPDGTGSGTVNVNRADGINKYLHVIAVDKNNNFDPAKMQTINLSDYLWWNVDSNNVLTIYPHELNWDRDHVNWVDTSGYTQQDWPWYPKHSVLNTEIVKAIISPGVTARGSLIKLFSPLRKMTSIEGLEMLDTSEVTNMASMFNGCQLLTSLDVSHFDTSQVTDMQYMFQSCDSLTSLHVEHFDTSKVTNMAGMFYRDSSLTGLDVSNFDTSQVTNIASMFATCQLLTNIDVSHFNTSKVTNMAGLFNGCMNLLSVNVTGFDTTHVTNMAYMFAYCKQFTNLDILNFDTSEVTDMQYMFYWCGKMTDLKFDPDKFKTNKVTNMAQMFRLCYVLKSLDVSKFDTSKVTNMQLMFADCSALKELDVSHFDTSNSTNINGMFSGCAGLTSIDVNHWNTNKVDNFNSLFQSCTKLTSLDLSSFNIRRTPGYLRTWITKNTPSLWKLTLGPNSVIEEALLTDPVRGTQINDLDQPTPIYYATNPQWQELGTGGTPHDPKGPTLKASQITTDSVTRRDVRTYVWDQTGWQTFYTYALIDFGFQKPAFTNKEVKSTNQTFTETDTRNARQGKTWKIEASVTKPMQLDTDSTKSISGNPLWFYDTDTGNKYNLTSTAQTVHTGAAGAGYQDNISIPWNLAIKTNPIDIPATGHYTGQVTFTLVNDSGI